MSPYGDNVLIDPRPAAEILKRSCKEAPLEYLTFGERASYVARVMHGFGATGISVFNTDLIGRQEAPELLASGRHKQIFAHITSDPRLVQVLDKTWRKSLTIEEIFVQFPGPYKVVAAVETGWDRSVVYHKCILACGPKIIILGEDGHNEAVVDFYRGIGYRISISEEQLIMVKP